MDKPNMHTQDIFPDCLTERVVGKDKKIYETVITEAAKQKPYYFVMRDASLNSDQVADNFEQIFKAYSRDTIRKIL